MRAAILAATLAWPSVAAADDDLQVWTALNIGGTIVGPVEGNLELAARFPDGGERLGVTFIRPTLGLRVSERVSVTLGYAEVTTRVPGRSRVNEDRYFQQLSATIVRAGRATISTRLRLEERTIDGSNDLGWRGRAQLRLVRATRPRQPSAVIWSEVFIAFNDTEWGARKGFDQVRSFAGVAIPIDGRVTVETGFLHRLQNRAALPNRSDFVLPMFVTLRF